MRCWHNFLCQWNIAKIDGLLNGTSLVQEDETVLWSEVIVVYGELNISKLELVVWILSLAHFKYLKMSILVVHSKMCSIDVTIFGFAINTAYWTKLGLIESTFLGYIIVSSEISINNNLDGSLDEISLRRKFTWKYEDGSSHRNLDGNIDGLVFHIKLVLFNLILWKIWKWISWLFTLWILKNTELQMASLIVYWYFWKGLSGFFTCLVWNIYR